MSLGTRLHLLSVACLLASNIIITLHFYSRTAISIDDETSLQIRCMSGVSVLCLGALFSRSGV